MGKNDLVRDESLYSHVKNDNDGLLQLHHTISGMATNSQLYLKVNPCDDPVIAIIERKDHTLRCSFTTRPTHAPNLNIFIHVMNDFKHICDAIEGICEVEVTALSGWGLKFFEQSKMALQDIFIHSHTNLDTQCSSIVYSVVGRYQGTSRICCDCQRYAKLASSDYVMLANYHET